MSNSGALSFRLPPPAFWPEQVVYNRTDGRRGVCTSITYSRRDVFYTVAWGHDCTNEHYAFELSDERPIDGVEPDD